MNRRVLDQRPGLDRTVEDLLEADRVARALAREEVRSLAAGASRT